MAKTVSTYRFLQLIGEKIALSNLGVEQNHTVDSINIKQDFPEYIEPLLTFPLEGCDTPLEAYPKIVLVSAAGATGKTAMCRHLSSKLNIPVFDLGIAREVASNSLTGALFKEFGPDFSKYLSAVQNGQQSIIIDALDEGLAKSGSNAFFAFIDDVISIASSTFGNTIPVVMLGRTQTISNLSDYLDKKGTTYTWLQISAFTRDQADQYIDQKVKPSEKYSVAYKELKEYIFNAIGSFVTSQSKVADNFLGYAPVLEAIATALRQNTNYKGLLEEYRQNNTKGISFILDVIKEIINREKTEKVNVFINEIKNDLTVKEYDQAIKNAYADLDQCKALMECIYGENFQINVSNEARINSEFSRKMSAFIEDHPFLNGNRFENTVFESYVLARLMIADPDNPFLELYLTDKYRDAYMLYYFMIELAYDKQLIWKYIPYIYRSLISLDKRGDYGQTSIIRNDNSEECSIFMFRGKDNKFFICLSTIDSNKSFTPGNILSNLTIDCPSINVTLDKLSTEIIPPVVCFCDSLRVASDIVINPPLYDGDECLKNNNVTIECNKFNIDFQSGHRPSLTINDNDVDLSINCANKLIPPFDRYFSASDIPGDFSEDFKAAFVKLRKILITFRSHSKGSMARYKWKINDARISGHDIGKLLIENLLKKGIIEDKGIMYHLNRDKTARLLGLTFDKLKTTSPTPQMAKFINEIIN